MWYVIQVPTGSEERMAALITQTVPADVLDECFVPRYATEVKVRGCFVSAERALWPGYLVAVTDDVLGLVASLAKLPEFCRVLKQGIEFVPLGADEVALVAAFTNKGARTVPMSWAYKDGERVVVVEGPLVGQEAFISRVDRGHSEATLNMTLCGRTVTTRVGLAVLSMPDDADARAAVLEARARACMAASEVA